LIDEAARFDRYIISNKQMKLTPDSSHVDSLFLYYYLSQPILIDLVKGQSIGSSVPGFNLGQLKSLPVFLPTLSDQRAIAEVLGALDDKIAANAGMVITSSELAALEFEKELREGGVEVELGAVTELLARGITPAYTEDSDAMTILNQKCVRDRRVDLEKARKTSLGKVRREKILRLGDVLVNSTGYGTLGRVARWTGSGQATVDSHITIVRFDSSKVERTCGGFALLSRVELGRLRIRVPRADAQGPLGSRLDALTRLVDSRLAESVRLAELRDALLPHLMSGRLRVKDAEKQVEAVV
jgi:type I restriction enzyme S subunit